MTLLHSEYSALYTHVQYVYKISQCVHMQPTEKKSKEVFVGD